MIVKFSLIKHNGHTAYTGELEEDSLKQFLHGSGAYKIQYEKDGISHEIINEEWRI